MQKAQKKAEIKANRNAGLSGKQEGGGKVQGSGLRGTAEQPKAVNARDAKDSGDAREDGNKTEHEHRKIRKTGKNFSV